MTKYIGKMLQEELNKYLLVKNFTTITTVTANHSTCKEHLHISDNLLRANDCGLESLLILLDLSKAFDALYHSILKWKLKYFSLDETHLTFFKSYLTPWRQRSFSGGKFSDFRDIQKGVPQGSLLHTLLFSLYRSELPDILKHCSSYQYADDKHTS